MLGICKRCIVTAMITQAIARALIRTTVHVTCMDFKLANVSGGLLPIPYIGVDTHMNLPGIMVTPRSATSSRSVDTTVHGILHHTCN